MPASTPAALPPPLTRLHCELSWRKSLTSGRAVRGGEGVRGRPPWRCERREWEESESASSCASSFLLSSFSSVPYPPSIPHSAFPRFFPNSGRARERDGRSRPQERGGRDASPAAPPLGVRAASGPSGGLASHAPCAGAPPQRAAEVDVSDVYASLK